MTPKNLTPKTRHLKPKLRIAIFHLAFIYSGGGEKLVLEEYKGLKSRGHQVTIFTPVLDRRRCFPDIIDQLEIKTLLPNLPSLIPQREAFQILLTCVLMPLIACRFKGFDVVLAANQPSLWSAWVVKRLYRVPYVAYLAQPTRFLYPRKIDRETGLIFAKRGIFSPVTWLLKVAKPLVDWADKVSIKGADLVLANGEYIKGVLEKTYGIKVVSCPAGAYPATRLAEYRKRFGGDLVISGNQRIGKPYILLTNRHFPQKRFEYAISALPSAIKKSPAVSLVVTGGETDYTKSLKSLVKQLSLEDKAIFLGFVKEKDLEKLYSNAAVYVYTAPEEDFGMGVVEAMARGTPVVAWNAAGPSKIIKSGITGLLAKPCKTADFADKMGRILTNKKFAEKIGRAAWEESKRKFSYRNHIDILESRLSSGSRK